MAVRVDLNISLDGYATTEGGTPENFFGDDWTKLTAAYVATRTFRERVLHDMSGEATTVREFLKAGLVDQLHVAIRPILLGRGINLWTDLRGYEDGCDVTTETAESGTM